MPPKRKPIDKNSSKVCVRCKAEKNIIDFPFVYQTSRGYAVRRSFCKICWNEHNREKYHIVGKFTLIKRLYGLSQKEYQELFTKQSGKCAICGKPEGINAYSFAVDHDHETGSVRGLLCARCNTQLGTLEDKNFISQAHKYLNEHKSSVRTGG